MLESQKMLQLQEALISAIPSLSKLKQFSRYKLGENLEQIVSCDGDLTDVAYNLIEWAVSTGKVEDFINAALKHNPTNPKLKQFVEEIWKPRQPQKAPTAPSQQKPETQRPTTSPSSTEKYEEHQSAPIVDINTKRKRSRRKSKVSGSNIEQNAKITPLPTPTIPFPETPEGTSILPPIQPVANKLSVMHNHVHIARTAIQLVYNIFRPGEKVAGDQCQFSIIQVRAANESIGTNLKEELSTFYIHDPAYARLEVEQQYFCDEADKTAILIRTFVSHTSSLSSHKEIWDKLQVLMGSLQDLDDLIDTLRAFLEESEINNQYG